MRATIKDVAKAASVSVATASMALNNKKGVNEKTRKHVEEVAKRLNYMPNLSARSLVTNKSDCIGLIVPEIVNPYYSSIVDIMTKLTEKAGLTLLLGISNNKSRVEKEYLQMFAIRQVLGVIIVPMLSDNPDTHHLEMIRAAKIPFVFCTERYPNCKEAAVMCDFEQGEYEMVRYLLEKDIKDFCFLTVDYKTHFTTLRMKGLIKAFEEKGLEIDKNNLFFLNTPRFQDAYDITDQMLKREPRAIVSINDIMAMGIIKRLSELKIRVPEDIWVAGFDDMMFAALAQVPITTVKQPLWEICGKSMELLQEKINNPHDKAKEDKVHFIPAELVIRETTG